MLYLTLPHHSLMQTNWTLRSLVHSWAQEHGIPVPATLTSSQQDPEEGENGPSSSTQSHPIQMPQLASEEQQGTSGTGQAVTVPESWTFFQGIECRPCRIHYRDKLTHNIWKFQSHSMMMVLASSQNIPQHSGFDSPGGDLFKLHCDTNSGMPAMAQLLGAADKVMISNECLYRMISNLIIHLLGIA